MSNNPTFGLFTNIFEDDAELTGLFEKFFNCSADQWSNYLYAIIEAVTIKPRRQLCLDGSVSLDVHMVDDFVTENIFKFLTKLEMIKNHRELQRHQNVAYKAILRQFTLFVQYDPNQDTLKSLYVDKDEELEVEEDDEEENHTAVDTGGVIVPTGSFFEGFSAPYEFNDLGYTYGSDCDYMLYPKHFTGTDDPEEKENYFFWIDYSASSQPGYVDVEVNRKFYRSSIEKNKPAAWLPTIFTDSTIKTPSPTSLLSTTTTTTTTNTAAIEITTQLPTFATSTTKSTTSTRSETPTTLATLPATPTKSATVADMRRFSKLDSREVVERLYQEDSHGPAILVTDEGEDKRNRARVFRDHVYCLKLSIWPRVAQRWINRKRYHGWPSKLIVNKIVSNGCHIVPIGIPNKKGRGAEWRLSFSIAEIQLAHSLDENIVAVYSLLKYLIKNELTKQLSVKSYHLKNVFFWACEEQPADFWEKENLSVCLLYFMEKLEKHLRCGRLGHYFVPENNLLAFEEPHALTRNAEILCEMRENPFIFAPVFLIPRITITGLNNLMPEKLN